MAESFFKLLVVDDDDLILQSIRIALPVNWKMTGIKSLSEVPSKLTFHAAFVDMHLTGNIEQTEGLPVIAHLRKLDPHLEIVAFSGNLDHNLMEACLKKGASRFLAKPLTKEELHLVLEKIEAHYLLQIASGGTNNKGTQWVGTSESSNEVRKQIASLSGEPGPILIEGESGTGKEVVASLLQQLNPKQTRIQVNVAAISENLFESEFFGHIKGAFTGADQNKMGFAEAAHGGDLFLDEIEALALPLQAKLLRFLESGEVRRVGQQTSIQVSTRVIAATNQNLQEMVKEGKFREDLLYRLSGKKIVLPPLRQRIEDIPILAEYFLSKEKPKRNKTLSPESCELLKKHPWPGNVRELKRVMEQVALNSPLPIIRPEDILSVIQPTAAISQESIDLSRGLACLLMDYEKRIISQALDSVRDIDETAKVLDISRSSLYKKIKDHGLPTTGGNNVQ